jgi:hypothetical protein
MALPGNRAQSVVMVGEPHASEWQPPSHRLRITAASGAVVEPIVLWAANSTVMARFLLTAVMRDLLLHDRPRRG